MSTLGKILIDVGVLAVVGAGTWFLTGLDKTDGGESKRAHHFTRILRCVGILFLTAIVLGVLEQGQLVLSDGPILIIVPVLMAFLLRSSVSELFTHGFIGLLDPGFHDQRPLDPYQAQMYQDAIAHLIHIGQRAEAIKLCERLKHSGEVDRMTIEHTLEFLGVKQAQPNRTRPLAEADNLRAGGRFAEAERLLKSLLAKNPADEGAALLLMRLYAQDLRQPERAAAVLQALGKQPYVSPGHLDFARRSLEEWSRPQFKPAEPVAPPLSAPPPTVDELIAQGGLGMAVEMLEEQIQARPDDFALRIKLAEIHAVRCKNLKRAEKIIQQLSAAGTFTPQQTTQAQARLKEWRAAASHPHGAA